MWIKTFKKRYLYHYHEEMVEIRVAHAQIELRPRRIWSSKLTWVEVEIWVGKKKYQKKPHHKKKVLTEKEVAKRDWRKEKQLKRDKAKPTWGANGCKKFCKRYGWKRHRRYSKKQLNAGNYSQLHRKDYKHFVNPWDWS